MAQLTPAGVPLTAATWNQQTTRQYGTVARFHQPDRWAAGCSHLSAWCRAPSLFVHKINKSVETRSSLMELAAISSTLAGLVEPFHRSELAYIRQGGSNCHDLVGWLGQLKPHDRV